MKRVFDLNTLPQAEEEEEDDQKMKRPKAEPEKETQLSDLDSDMLFEILKFVDATTLGRAACVSKMWKKTAYYDKIWETVCTKHWVDLGCPQKKVHNVVCAIGGFRLLHSSFLRPVLKASAWAHHQSTTVPERWGKEEVHLSLFLQSTKYYMTMECTYKGKKI